LGTTLTNQNSVPEEIKNRLKAESACYCSLPNLLSSSLLFKNINITAYGTIILPAVLYGCETWSLTFRKECKLGVLKNRMLRIIIGHKRDKVTGECRKLHNEEFTDLYSLPNVIQVIKSGRLRWVGNVASKGQRIGA
jgi:hypothetical protein